MEQVISEKSIAESLKIVMVKKGTNINQLAKHMGMTSAALYKKFSKDKFSNEDLDRICDNLGIKYQVSFILDEE